jgi:hypothetical protein
MRLGSTVLKASAGALGLVMLSGASAYAVNWASASAPLTVKGQGSTGKGYGSWQVSSGGDGTRSRLTANLWYHNADDHKVFARMETWVNSGICVAPQYTSCSAAYYFEDDVDTRHSNQNDRWVNVRSSTGVPGSASYARAGIQVKLDVPFEPDPESRKLWAGGMGY